MKKLYYLFVALLMTSGAFSQTTMNLGDTLRLTTVTADTVVARLYRTQADGSSPVFVSSAKIFTIVPTAAGTFYYAVMLTGLRGSATPLSSVYTVTVNQPNAYIMASSHSVYVGSNVTLTAMPQIGGSTYQWSRNGAAISGATNATYTASESTPSLITYGVTIANNSTVNSASTQVAYKRHWTPSVPGIDIEINGGIQSVLPAADTIATLIAGLTTSAPISLNGVSNMTISGKRITGGSSPCISLNGCNNIHITLCALYGSTDRAIYLYNCTNITIDYNFMSNVSTGVGADHCGDGTTAGIQVNHNYFYNMQGPYPLGQFCQFNTVKGGNCSVSYNTGEQIAGSSVSEDLINMYSSTGLSGSPIIIQYNRLRGGGPSNSSSGIMLGDGADEGGGYQISQGNYLVNTGAVGTAISGGDHCSLLNNKIYGDSHPYSNVGLYVNQSQSSRPTNSDVNGNRIYFYAASGYLNPWYLGTADRPAHWDNDNGGTNVLNDTSITASILPVTLIDSRLISLLGN